MEGSCFNTAYLSISLIHFEGTFLTNIIDRQSNGEMSTTTIGHNCLSLLQNADRKLSQEFLLVLTDILLKRSSTNEVKSLLTSSAYTLVQQNTSPVLIRSRSTLPRIIVCYCELNLKEI